MQFEKFKNYIQLHVRMNTLSQIVIIHRWLVDARLPLTIRLEKKKNQKSNKMHNNLLNHDHNYLNIPCIVIFIFPLNCISFPAWNNALHNLSFYYLKYLCRLRELSDYWIRIIAKLSLPSKKKKKKKNRLSRAGLFN